MGQHTAWSSCADTTICTASLTAFFNVTASCSLPPSLSATDTDPVGMKAKAMAAAKTAERRMMRRLMEWKGCCVEERRKKATVAMRPLLRK